MRLFGSLISFPYVILFFAVWIIASLVKPIAVLSLVCVLSNPVAAMRKFRLFIWTLQYLLLCNDKTWKKPADPAPYFAQDGAKLERKTIIFVRHGESTWNDTFNKGDRSSLKFALSFVPGVFKAILNEWYFWVSGMANESWFFDAPLSEKGLKQAQSIQTFLQTDAEHMPPKEAVMMKLLLGLPAENEKTPQAQMVSSNLRRSISTMAVGFQDRFAKQLESDTLMILPALQEISRNPDALSITPANGKVLPAWTDPKTIQPILEKQVDTGLHFGNKNVTTNGLKRMNEFCEIAFDKISKDAIICGGHSLWFRSFFRTYLPHSFEHISKKKKLINGGIVGFELQRIKVDNKYHYMIDPKSLVVMHGGF